jgi:ABC-type Fe3+-hydroxamate transport system substrate-binding protein
MRIVSLVPSITEAVCMLGLGDALVGITDYCLHPTQIVASKVLVGGTKRPRIREIQTLSPDLVIVNTDENRIQTCETLKSLGLHVLVTSTDSLDQVEATWMQLGDATGTTGLARHYREQIAAARALTREALRGVRPLSTLIPVWRDPWIASGSGTYMESLLAECGFRNVFSQADRKWPKVALTGNKSDDELALPQRPELILLPSEPYHFDEADRDSLVEIGFLREQITFVDGVLLSWWLSRTAAALKQFRELRMARGTFSPAQ